jgi:hypothetical protein
VTDRRDKMNYETLVNFVLRNKVMVRHLLSLDERDKDKLITLMNQNFLVDEDRAYEDDWAKRVKRSGMEI